MSGMGQLRRIKRVADMSARPPTASIRRCAITDRRLPQQRKDDVRRHGRDRRFSGYGAGSSRLSGAGGAIPSRSRRAGLKQ